MTTVRRLWTRLQSVARATLDDLFGEGAPSQPDGAPGVSELEALQARLAELHAQLAVLAAHRQRLAEAEARAAAGCAALDRQVDEAVTAGEDARARALLAQLGQAQAQRSVLAGRQADLTAVIESARADLAALNARLAAVHRQSAELADRLQAAAGLEGLARERRALDRALSRLQEELALRSTQVARAEGRAAAWRDMD